MEDGDDFVGVEVRGSQFQVVFCRVLAVLVENFGRVGFCCELLNGQGCSVSLVSCVVGLGHDGDPVLVEARFEPVHEGEQGAVHRDVLVERTIESEMCVDNVFIFNYWYLNVRSNSLLSLALKG